MLLALYFVAENIITITTNLLNLTRLPSNLSSTTRECVHLVRLHVVTSRHVIKMAVTLFDPPYTKIPCYTQTLWLYVLYNRSYCRWKFYNAGIGIFDLLLLWPWSWPSDLHRRTWPVFRKDTSDVQIWSSYVKAFESIVWQTAKDRQTDTAEIIYRVASRVNYTIYHVPSDLLKRLPLFLNLEGLRALLGLHLLELMLNNWTLKT